MYLELFIISAIWRGWGLYPEIVLHTTLPQLARCFLKHIIINVKHFAEPGFRNDSGDGSERWLGPYSTLWLLCAPSLVLLSSVPWSFLHIVYLVVSK